MLKYELRILSAIVAIYATQAFVHLGSLSIGSMGNTPRNQRIRRQVAASPNIGFPDNEELAIQTTIKNVTDALSKAVSSEDDEVEEAIAVKRKIVNERRTGSYEVRMSIAPSSLPIGVTLCQVYPGLQLSSKHLDMDSLVYEEAGDIANNAFQRLNFAELTETLGKGFQGVIVSSVADGGQGCEGGIQVGDILVASSATLGTVSFTW